MRQSFYCLQMDKKSLERSWMKVKNQVKKICKCFDITTIKFILVGIVNTIVGTGVMFFLYNFCSVNYWIASASNYIVGSIVSYFLNKYFTFKSTERSTRQIVKFIINISVFHSIWCCKTSCSHTFAWSERKGRRQYCNACRNEFVCNFKLFWTEILCIPKIDFKI